MNWSYLFKHWFGTLLLGPIILQIIAYYNYTNSQDIFSFFEMYFVFFFCSLIFSLPTYALYALLFSFLEKINLLSLFSKIILIAFAVTGIIVTFWLIGGNSIDDLALTYCIASVIAGLLFKLESKEINQKSEPSTTIK